MKRRMLLNQANDDQVLPGDGSDITPPAEETTPSEEGNTPPVEGDTPPAEEDLNLFEEDDTEDDGLDIPVDNVEYELELGEESKIPEAEFDALVALASEQGLSKEEAQARLGLMEKSYSSAEDLYVKTRADKMKQDLFQDEYFNSQEKRKESQEDIARALKEYRNPELVKLVKEDPFVRNNKTIMRLLVDMGRSLRPEKLPNAQSEGVRPPSSDSNSEMLKQYYPSMFAEN